jgi:hypothetical protein
MIGKDETGLGFAEPGEGGQLRSGDDIRGRNEHLGGAEQHFSSPRPASI